MSETRKVKAFERRSQDRSEERVLVTDDLLSSERVSQWQCRGGLDSGESA